jgi:hypothetical protein
VSRRVWVVGRIPLRLRRAEWVLRGVYSSHQAARAACTGPHDFIYATRLNRPVPVLGQELCEFPHLAAWWAACRWQPGETAV